MIFYSIGKRIKKFLKVKIYSPEDSKKNYSYKKNSYDLEDEIADGIRRYYFESGKLKSECCFLNGVLDGISNLYYENGNIRLRESYKSGLLDGLTKEYDENGNLIVERQFRKGNMIKKIKYS